MRKREYLKKYFKNDFYYLRVEIVDCVVGILFLVLSVDCQPGGERGTWELDDELPDYLLHEPPLAPKFLVFHRHEIPLGRGILLPSHPKTVPLSGINSFTFIVHFETY